jgi:tetratricopeptide (TPR) repeat protein
MLRGQQQILAKRYSQAISDFQTAVTLPSNLPSGGRGGVGNRDAELAYWTGVAYEQMGDRARAAEAWNRGVAPRSAGAGRRGGEGGAPPPVTWGSSAVGAGLAFGGTAAGGAQAYYQALCYQKLGQSDRAGQLFKSLVESGQRAVQQPEGAAAAAGPGARRGRQQSPRVRLAEAHYITGLGYLGLNEPEKAKTELGKAVEFSPDLLGARVALTALK